MPFFKKKIVSRNIDPTKPNQLIWRIPNATHTKIKDIDEILVRDYEKAVFVKDGVFLNILSSGSHSVLKDINEIIWIDVSPKRLPFGIPIFTGPVTMDNYQIGLSGTITLRLIQSRDGIRNFLLEMVTCNKMFDAEQIVEWLRKGPLVTILRDAVKKLTLEQFKQDREQLINQDLKPKLNTEISKYGIELTSMDITGMTEPKKVESK